MKRMSISILGTRSGVARISFEGSGASSLDGSPEGLDFARRGLAQLQEYLAGDRTSFDLPVDLDAAPDLTPFRRSVLEALRTVPFGETLSYGELADEVRCRSPRAVGQAVGWNPLPILIPCHRVIAQDGGLGGYSGGLDRKEILLAIEGVRLES